jgi:hypothetical protein
MHETHKTFNLRNYSFEQCLGLTAAVSALFVKGLYLLNRLQRLLNVLPESVPKKHYELYYGVLLDLEVLSQCVKLKNVLSARFDYRETRNVHFRKPTKVWR